MFNISKNTEIKGYTGKISSFQQAMNDRNLHEAPRFEYFGKRVQRGVVDVLIGGEKRTVRFESAAGWLKKLEVL